MKQLEFNYEGKKVILKDIQYYNYPDSKEEQGYEEIVFDYLEIEGQEIDGDTWEDFENHYIDGLYKIAIQEFLNAYYKKVKI
jgi:hypothetical protein